MDATPLIVPGEGTPSNTGGLGLSKADLHMHTNMGDGLASPRQIVDQAKRHGLKVIAITDHDHMEGVKRVQDLVDREGLDIQIIWGSEVTTRQGHFLGLFMKRRVKFLTHVEGAIDAIKEQGGLTIIPHPMGKLVPSLSRRKIEELLTRGYPLDAIEIYNPSPANSAFRREVQRLNKQWGFAETGSSDAHFWQHIGSGYTLFPGETAEDLRQSILNHTTRPGGQETPPTRLPVTAYIGQCFWSMVLDPPRKIARFMRSDEKPMEATTSSRR